MLSIIIHRGDYAKKNISIVDSEGNQVTDFTSVYFTVKYTTSNENYILQKKLNNGITQNDDGTYTLEILPEDTDSLVCKDYVFDIQVYKEEPLIKQTILGTLSIKKEVTYASNEE